MVRNDINNQILRAMDQIEDQIENNLRNRVRFKITFHVRNQIVWRFRGLICNKLLNQGNEVKLGSNFLQDL
jgi:hypothetical protein